MAAALALLATACSGSEQPATIAFDRVSTDDVAHGERVARVLGCIGCHGEDLQGRDWSDELGTLWTANLTRSAEAHDNAELVEMVVSGRRPDRDLHGMPSRIFTHVDTADLEATMAFIRSRPVGGATHPEPTFGPPLRRMMADGSYKSSRQEVVSQAGKGPPDAGERYRLGRYIARATCAECHGADLKGGKAVIPGDVERPDLTMMVPAYEPADFARLLHEGKAAGDREIGLMSEVARGRYAHLTPAEVEAVRVYIVAIAKEGQ